MSSLKYWIWLAGRKNLAGQNAMRVLEHFGSPEKVYFSDAEEYRMIDGLNGVAVQSLSDKSLDRADQILGDCDRLGIRILTLQDAVYPERLSAIHQPPMVLYTKGRPISFDEEAAIAMVGTRDATPYGQWAATQLSMELTRCGALVVTGMAEGIDAAAIKGALKAGGSVVSVLGGGIDVVYPREHYGLYADVASIGMLVSEYPPGTAHLGGHFPVRNRIISGLSVGVIAVESKRFGGTMHTVSHALEQDRDVFAVPGPIDAPSSEGTNRLIQEGAAKLVMNADDVISELIYRFPNRLQRKVSLDPEISAQRIADALPSEQGTVCQAKKTVDKELSLEYIDWQESKKKLTEEQIAVLQALEHRCMCVDDLVEETQLDTRRILSSLTMLQIHGYVAEESGKRFRALVRLKME